MTGKELIEQLKQYDENELDNQIWFHHKLKGKIMPAEITCPINTIEYTADGLLLSNRTGDAKELELDAIKAWNTRQPDLEAEIERLKDLLVKIYHRTYGFGCADKTALLNKLINIYEWCKQALKE